MIEIREGIIYADGCSAKDIAAEYGTPVYVMSREYIASKCARLRECFTEKYPKARAAYAGKAFLNKKMCRIIEEEGLCLDVVSGGELYTAIKAEFPPERIEFNGNNKSEEELEMAARYGVGRIIIDGTDEAELIEKIYSRYNKTAKVLLRISPGVDSHTHKYITTGNVDSKFGIPLDAEIFKRVFNQVMESGHMELMGFHFHIGSQLHENDSYLMATGILLGIIEKLRKEEGFCTREVNIGGGFGIRYTDEDNEKDYSYFLDPVMDMITKRCKKSDMPMPAVIIEPGRSIAANAGMTLYTVGTVKNIPGVRKYVSVDGGMGDNIRPALYVAAYECYAETNSGSNEETVTICGKYCESGDILIRDAKIKMPSRGDLLAVFGTGAYCMSMGSNYNRVPLLPVVLANEGQTDLMMRRQTYDDLLSRDI